MNGTRLPWALSNGPFSSNRPIFLQRDRHWANVMGQRLLIGSVELPRPTPLAPSQLGGLPPQVGGSPIERGYPACGIGRVDGGRKLFESLTEALLRIKRVFRLGCPLRRRMSRAAVRLMLVLDCACSTMHEPLELSFEHEEM
jgi:hypothetical protein